MRDIASSRPGDTKERFSLENMQWIAERAEKITAVVMLLTFLLGCALAIHAGPHLRYEDENDYRQIAVNLAQLHRFTVDGSHITAFRPPGYVWFLAIPEMMHISNTGLRLLNVCALPFCQLFLFLLASSLAGRGVAALAVLLSVAYPLLVYTATVLFPQTVASALFLCGLWLILDRRPLTVWRALVAGVVWAALILAVPTFLVILGVLVIWLSLRRQGFWKRLTPLVATVALLVGCWSLRNYRVFHSFVLVSTNGGVNLLLGNSENATADSGVAADISKYTIVRKGMSETDGAQYFSRSAKKWIETHPGQAARLYVAKLIHYFAFSDTVWTKDRAFSVAQGSRQTLLMVATYGPLLVLFALRIAVSAKYPMSEGEICLTLLYFFDAFFSAIFFTRIRFRVPMDWLLLLIDASTIAILLNHFTSRSRGQPISVSGSAESSQR